MCSVQDGDTPLKKGLVSKSIGRICIKCQEEKAILITRMNDAFCRACFQVYVTHKFRATIGKTKLVRDGELVLVAFSGGPSSSALLHLIQEGLSQRAHKKLRFKPGIVYIDEGAVLRWSVEERLSNCGEVQEIMTKTGFPCYMKGLEEALDLETVSLPDDSDRKPVSPVLPDCDTDSLASVGTASVTLPDLSPYTSPAFRNTELGPLSESSDITGNQSRYQVFDEKEKQLKLLLGSIKSTSGKEDFIRTLRNKLVLEVARHCGYSKVMMGNCGTQLAVRLLTDMAVGRGSHAAMETAFADKRNSDIMVLRPLREFSSKEIAMYNNLYGVEPVFIPTITTKAPVGASIEHLTESFVTGLQADYPATVSNIMRTGEKLDSSGIQKTDSYCAMCQVPLDTSVSASSALSAVEFSRSISRRNRDDPSADNSQCCGEGDGSCQSTANRLKTGDIINNLCYGCRLIAHEIDDKNKLPEYVLKDISWRTRRSKMKEDIQEFLLDQS